jgi:ribonuclease Y
VPFGLALGAYRIPVYTGDVYHYQEREIMMDVSAVYIIVVVGAGLIAGVVIGFFVRKNLVESRVEAIEKYSKKVLAEAQKEAKTTKREAALQAKDTLYQMKVEFEKETKEKKESLALQEKRVIQKREALDKKIEQLEKKDERISEERKRGSINVLFQTRGDSWSG